MFTFLLGKSYILHLLPESRHIFSESRRVGLSVTHIHTNRHTNDNLVSSIGLLKNTPQMEVFTICCFLSLIAAICIGKVCNQRQKLLVKLYNIGWKHRFCRLAAETEGDQIGEKGNGG